MCIKKLLANLSKLFYRFSTNAVYVYFSIIGDRLLNNDDFGVFTIVISLQILTFNITDIFNYKYLLGKLSENNNKKNLNIYVTLKVFFGIVPIVFLAPIFFIYNISLFTIVILVLTNYIQLISSTVSTYVFVNEKNNVLMNANLIGLIFSLITIILYYIIAKKIELNTIILSIFVYRYTEFFKLKPYIQNVNSKYISCVNKRMIFEASPFYLQMLLSIGSGKLFMLFTPFFLSYDEIAIIGTYGYLTAVPLFFISIYSMTGYSDLIKGNLTLHFDKINYWKILRQYYLKSSITIFACFVVQVIYITIFSSQMSPYLGFIFIHDVCLIFTAMQGFLLFFFKLNKLIIYISVFTLIFKNSLMLCFIHFYNIKGFLISTLFTEIFVILLITFFVKVQINNKDTVRVIQ